MIIYNYFNELKCVYTKLKLNSTKINNGNELLNFSFVIQVFRFKSKYRDINRYVIDS